MEDVDFSVNVSICPSIRSHDWIDLPIKDIENLSTQLPIILPELNPDDIQDIFSFTGGIVDWLYFNLVTSLWTIKIAGPYIATQAQFYVTLCRKYELLPRLDANEFESMADYLEQCNSMPESLTIHARHVDCKCFNY